MNEEVIRSFLVSIGYQTDETSLRKFTLSLEAVTKKVMALGVAVAATATAVIAGVKIVSSQMERLYYASQRTGETVGNIMALRYAAGQIGLTADQAQASLEGFTRTLRLNPGMNGLLQQLGVSGNSPLEQFESFIGKMKQMQPYIAASYAGLFGIDPDTLLMLENGLTKLQTEQEKYRAKLGSFGINPDQAAQAGTDFDNSLRNLSGDVQLFWVLLQEHLAPVLTTIATRFERWAATHADQTAQKIADALEAVANWVSQIDWDEVGKDVDIFLRKAWDVAKVIGNIIGSFARVARWFGVDDSRPDGKPDSASGPDQTDGDQVSVTADRNTPPDASPDDSPFIAWVKRQRWAFQRWTGTTDSPGASRPGGQKLDESQFSIVEIPSSRAAPRGIRNNNPGNIEYGPFARDQGATGSDGRFAVFQSMEDGIHATIALLHSYASRGIDTIRTIISKWAPGNENNTQAYIDFVRKRLGISADSHLNGEQLADVARSIFAHENGSSFDRLGAKVSPTSSRAVTVSQKTDVHVHGSSDPHGTARSVANEQSRVNADLVRNMTGAYV